VELRHLRYFVAVAEQEHVARAARRLHVSASPLSRQIQQLEKEIGVELFARVGRNVRLTPVGTVFLDEVRGALGAIDRAVSAAQAASRGETGRLRIGFVEMARVAGLIPMIIRQFRALHPDVGIELHPMRSQDQLLALDDGRLDAALTYKLGSEPPTLKIETLFVERVQLIVPRDHPLAKRRRIVARDLAGAPLIWLPRREAPYYFDLVHAALQEHGVEPKVLIESPSAHTRMSLVASGMGVTFSVPSATKRFDGIVARPVTDVRIDVVGALVSRRRDAQSLPLRSLREIVLAATGSRDA
jgi:LysR family transcriptional regulator, benzoate and cis,cis-muconate-responsive activator of ben and cat genes